MMRLVEAAVFLSLAASAHVGLWAAFPAPNGASSAGDTGADAATVAPASAAMAALAETWERPPEAVTDIALPQQPTAETAPQRPVEDRPASPAALPEAPQFDMAAPALPTRPAPLPDLQPQTEVAQPAPPEAMPQDTPAARTDARPAPAKPDQLAAVTPPTDMPQVQDTTASTSKRPMLRPRDLAPPAKAKPAAKPKPKATASAPQPKSTAKGSAAKSATAGTGGAAQTQSVSTARANALQAQWGAAIQSKVRRNAASPRGAGAGRTKLALSIAPSGVLQSVRVVASSGNATLDKAAISAVKRARRFARAPGGLTKPAYTFTIALDFNG
ncbi:TonB family protein [uncultured Pseudosulfitobacter sp.]|uniref:energy transducer TonB n=1 Tax=uncultured Pseudosulfitobacter sp. TaxID=2854214 RepID=UPI0030DBFEBF|tara:strand:+ start:4811 stop:5797 length:987 start_codon:yes stop_codon:yes gene_type:complete